MRKPTFWYPTWSDTNQAVQVQKMVRSLKVWIKKVEVLYYLCGETKALISFAVSASLFSHKQNVGFLMTRLICVFVPVGQELWLLLQLIVPID